MVIFKVSGCSGRNFLHNMKWSKKGFPMVVNGKIPVTAVIFTLNEEKNIEDCLSTLVDFQDIVVVDSGSKIGRAHV